MAGSTDNAQQKEIDEIKESFGKFCKVISNIGDFSNVVEITREDSALRIKFQLTGAVLLLLVSLCSS